MASHQTWGVVVVHGVGDTEPGASLEAFLANLLPERKTLTEDGPASQWLLVEPPQGLPKPGDLRPPAYSEETLDDKAKRFASNVRTFTNTAQGQPERVVFAEVFWADLSRAGTSRLEVLRRVIGLIFDLRHVSDVASAHPGPKAAKTLRLALYTVSWLLCGPIGGFTAFILALLLGRYVGVSLHELIAKAPPSPDLGDWAALLFSIAAAIALGWFAHWRKRSAWAADGAWTLFSGWAIVAALATAATAAIRHWLEPQFPWDNWFGKLLMQRLVLGETPDTAMATHLVVLLGLTYAAFAVLALASIASAILWLVARAEAAWVKSDAVPALDAALGVSVLQVLLWVILGTALGSVVVDRFVPQQRDSVESVALGFTLALGIALALAACAVLVIVRRKLWVRARQFDSEPGIPRLLLNALIVTALVGLGMASVVVFAWAFITGDVRLYHELKFLAAYAKPAGAVLAAAASLPMIFSGVRSALHILIDITSHFYRPRLRPYGDVGPGQFSIQQRIEGRFRRVLQEVLASGEVTHVTILAHSQGTIIALDVLWLEWAKNLLAGKSVSLVTMGSPISHLYQHYFPHRYPPLFSPDGKLNRPWGTSLDVTVQRWLNVYRADDYIGTIVQGREGFPVNVRSPTLGGHTGYWADKEVRKLLLNAQVLPG